MPLSFSHKPFVLWVKVKQMMSVGVEMVRFSCRNQHEGVGGIVAWKGAGEISDSNKVLVIDTYLFFLSKYK